MHFACYTLGPIDQGSSKRLCEFQFPLGQGDTCLGSRVRSPAKKDFMRDACRLRGGLNEHVVIVDLDIAKLRAFQSREKRWPREDDPYKPIPEGYVIAPFRKTTPS